VTRWVVAELQRRALRPAVLHGGYAADEPALHRRWNPQVPVIVGRDRIASARRAVEAGATALVLDDGFQHRRLARDLDLALVAAESWAPRPRLLPRGPWREPARALARAPVVVVNRKTASARAARELLMALRAFAPGAAAVQLWLRPAGWSRGVFFAGGNGGPGGRVSESGAAGSGSSTAPAASVSSGSGPQREAVAVTAIAHPALFVANAGEAGAQVAETLFFRDHHDYTDSDLEHIRQVAAGRPIVTTTKDLVKLGPLAPDLDLWVLEQEVVVEEGAAALSDLLDQISARARAR
jgi:tetraacyldisaccharide 4'-kinase